MWNSYLCISCLLYITYVLWNLFQLLTFTSNLTKEPKKCEKSFYLYLTVLQLYKKGWCFIALWRKENILGGVELWLLWYVHKKFLLPAAKIFPVSNKAYTTDSARTQELPTIYIGMQQQSKGAHRAVAPDNWLALYLQHTENLEWARGLKL